MTVTTATIWTTTTNHKPVSTTATTTAPRHDTTGYPGCRQLRWLSRLASWAHTSCWKAKRNKRMRRSPWENGINCVTKSAWLMFYVFFQILFQVVDVSINVCLVELCLSNIQPSFWCRTLMLPIAGQVSDGLYHPWHWFVLSTVIWIDDQLLVFNWSLTNII